VIQAAPCCLRPARLARLKHDYGHRHTLSPADAGRVYRRGYSRLGAGCLHGLSRHAGILQSPPELARRFGTSAQEATDKIKSVAWRIGRRGAPILREELAFFECAVQADIPAGDHRIVLGQGIDGALLRPTGMPLPYADTHKLDNSAALYPRTF
jgi:hypothetical protein